MTSTIEAGLAPSPSTTATRLRLGRTTRAASFLGAAALDTILAPILALASRHRPSPEAVAAAGLPHRSTYALAVARVRRRRLERRYRHRLRERGPSDLQDAVELVGAEHLATARATGRGTLLVSTHGVPQDVVPAALRLHGIELFDVRLVAPPSWTPPLAHRLVDVEPHPERRAALLVDVLAALRAGHVVRMPLEGFGVPSAHPGTSAGAAALARLERIPAFPVIASVSPAGRARVTIGDGVPPATTRADDERFVAELDAAFADLLADDPIARLERATMIARLVAAAHGERT
jgi:hypothetical protein